MMRIAYVIDSLRLGGAQRLVVTFAQAISEKPVELTVITLKASPSYLWDELESLGITVEAFPGRTLLDPRRLWRLYRYVRKSQFDLLHSHLGYANIYTSVISGLTSIPAVATLHNVMFGSRRGHFMRSRLEILALRGFIDQIIGVGDSVVESLQHHLPNKKIKSIPNAVPSLPETSETIRQSIRTEILGHHVGPLLVGVGRLTKQKGFSDLIEAFVTVHNSYPDVVLAIAGQGKLHDSLQSQISARSLEEHVCLLGPRDDIPDLLQSSDLFVSSSHWEGLPIAILEAMSAGLPIVATDVGEVRKVVGDEAGIIVPPKEPEALASAIMTMLDSSDQRSQSGLAAKKRIDQEYSADQWANRLLALYEEVIQSGRKYA